MMVNFVIGWVTAAIVYIIIFLSFSTQDNLIKSGNKFKIENAVYQCNKLQELDLK